MAAAAISADTRALTAQLRGLMRGRAVSSRAGAPKPPTAAAAAALPQRRHLNVAQQTPSAGQPSRAMLGWKGQQQQVPTPEGKPVTDDCSHVLLQCQPMNEGKQVMVEFADGSRYEFHGSWLRDSNPARRGQDFYRTSADDVWSLDDFRVMDTKPIGDGERLLVTYEAKGVQLSDEFEARWLHAFAPFVGKAVKGGVLENEVKGTGTLLGARQKRTSWRKDVQMPTFDAKALAGDIDAQVEFLERLVDPGIGLITGLDAPESTERLVVGKPLEALVFGILGKLNQHPVRATNYVVMRKAAQVVRQGADYDHSNPLSMHTDHTVYQGTPGFFQFLHQAQGSVRSKVCDGLALAEYLREHHPREFKILTTVEMTHSSRNVLYTREGGPRDVFNKDIPQEPFELVHTHPVIKLDANGEVEQVIQSETKRAVSALPYDVYDDFMKAYKLWVDLCEDDRFIHHFDFPEGSCVVTNNWRTLHGRAVVAPEMERTLCIGYVNKILVENRYRYLKQLQTERDHPNMDDRWVTRVPNQVLERMVR